MPEWIWRNYLAEFYDAYSRRAPDPARLAFAAQHTMHQAPAGITADPGLNAFLRPRRAGGTGQRAERGSGSAARRWCATCSTPIDRLDGGLSQRMPVGTYPESPH